MSVVEKNDPKEKKQEYRLVIWILIIGIMGGSLYSFYKSPQFEKISDKFAEIKEGIYSTKEMISEIEQKKREVEEALSESEGYEPYERDDNGFAYDDFETDYDY